MWGGLKKRINYGDLFKKWSASRGLEELRIALYKEPRPWYLAYALHQHNHLLQDHHCARLLSWSTSIVELRPTLAAKQEAYQYTQEMFQIFMRYHKVGRETLNEYLRLCAVGADLTSGFEWFKYWQEAQLDDGAALHTLSWLLECARVTPNDERAEDMALTVMELYLDRFAEQRESVSDEQRGSSGSEAPLASSLQEEQQQQQQRTPPFHHYAPTAPEDVEALRRFFSVFKSLEPRLHQNEQLRGFLDTIPLSRAAADANCAEFGWPVESAHRLFPQLEQHIHTRDGAQDSSLLCASVTAPRLRDSLLHPAFVEKLQSAAANHSVGEVVALVEEYERRVAKERAKTGDERAPTLHRRSNDELWRRHADPSAMAFRRRLIAEGGVTPELYHYLITALATTQPTAALRTLEGMKAANLQPLDLTRAAVLVAVRGSTADQRRLFRQQLDEIDARARLDADHETVKAVEVYWKYDYVSFFHYRNALSRMQFLLFLLARLGPQPVQQLLLDTQTHGQLATAEDLVVLDDDLRHASRLFFRAQVGRGAVQSALDAVSHHMPKLDISLVGTLPHFENYFVEAADEVAHSEAAIQALLQPYSTIYVLDTSFIETSESFLSVGASSPSSSSSSFSAGETGGGGAGSDEAAPSSKSLVLIPYFCLAQLASSVSRSDTFTSFDPALQQAIRSEPFLASQRLRALFAMISSSSTACPPSLSTPPAAGTTKDAEKGDLNARCRRARVLHFSECLCANQVEPALLDRLHLSPASNDNDQLLLVLAMLSSLKPSTARLVLCTDDTQLVEQLATLQSFPLFASAVEVVSTAPPANFDLDKDLVDDNPVWRDARMSDVLEFEPRLSVKAEVPPQGSALPHDANTGGAEREQQAVIPPKSEFHDSAQDTLTAVSAEDTIESPWLALLDEENLSTASTSAVPPAPFSPTISSSSASTDDEQDLRDQLMNLYETPYDVVPVGVRMRDASALGSVFDEFDSIDPEQREARAADRAAARSRLAQGDSSSRGQQQQKRRRYSRGSPLEKEMLANRGYSNKDRFQMARRLSNQSGGRVPFNMRYRVVEANVRDPRNAHLRKVYEEGLAKKRAAFKRHRG